ncbi:MAG: hypothetical protein WCG80_16735 [Spirochaetales bacterium]
MKKFTVFLVMLLALGAADLSAKGFSSGRSFGSSSFKSIQSLKTTPSTSGSTSLSTTRSTTALVPSYSPPMFFFFPMGGFGSGAAIGSGGWLLVLIVGGVILFFLFRPRRTVMAEGRDDDEELELFYQRCEKNLNHLTNVYVDAQGWLERLDGKIPHAQFKDWNDRYTRISIEDFTKQLAEIRTHLDKGEHVTARAMLFSFDEDAVEVFNFLQEVENAVEDIA